ncbi:hypothetical protein CP488_00283 [Chthonomonas calidirosea]|nr:hypothetical protein CP488_00283 [Chthonomonas calidirosea]
MGGVFLVLWLLRNGGSVVKLGVCKRAEGLPWFSLREMRR